MWHVWREGMSEWKRAYEVPEVKLVIMEGRGEVLDEVVQEYVKNLSNNKEGGKKKKREEEDSEPSIAKQDDQDTSQDNDSLFYYSKEDQAYKVFDPRTKKWSA